MSVKKPIYSKTLEVTVIKKIRIDVMPSALFGGTEQDLIRDWSSGFWKVESMNDIIKFAAETAFDVNTSIVTDGLGRVVRNDLAKNDGKDNYIFTVVDEETETVAVCDEPK